MAALSVWAAAPTNAQTRSPVDLVTAQSHAHLGGSIIENRPLRQRRLEWDAQAFSQSIPDKLPATVGVRLFSDVRLEMNFTEMVPIAGGCAWWGHVADHPGSAVTLTRREGRISAVIHLPGRPTYEILTAAQGDVVVNAWRSEARLACGGQPDPHRGGGFEALGHRIAKKARAGASPQAFSTGSTTGGCACDDGSVIDLLVVYTEDARIAAGGTTLIEDKIALAVADTNAAYTRSLINTSVRLVHTAEISYTESGAGNIDGPRLVATEDGYLDDVHPLRDQYGADCVSLWVEQFDAGGIGYFPHPSLTGTGASGFNIVRQDQAPFLVLAHELGHNLYCEHDRDNLGTAPPFAAYSYGYREPGGAWRTIMAYPPGALIPYFANPNVNWPGPVPPNPGPTGVPDTEPEPSDIALTINQLRHAVANFRPTAITGLPSRLYVAAGAAPGGDGTSWGTAIQDLQQALCKAAGSNGDVTEIWVKQGTYKPDCGTGDRAATFCLIDGVTLYGGFLGNETLLSQRDPVSYITTLSGDIGTVGDDTDNSYHVVTGSGKSATAILDGFTITAGYADGTGADSGGGGLLVYDGGSPTIRKCTFVFNSGVLSGGAVYNYVGANPTFEDCTFLNNTCIGADWPAGGGGVYSYNGCNPVFLSCRFESNHGNLGAGMACLFDSDPMLIDTTFITNSADGNDAQGGGLYTYSGSDPFLVGCKFENNNALVGGGMANLFDGLPRLIGCEFRGGFGPANNQGAGMYNYSYTHAELDQCLFIDNTAAAGGGMLNIFDCEPTVTNTRFLNNSAVPDGGAVYNSSNSHGTFANCEFGGNSASFGGAMILLFSSEPEIINCSLNGNIATSAGGGIYSYQSSPTLANTLLWGNAVGGSMNQAAQLTGSGTTPQVAYCSIQGGAAGLGGVGNDGLDPLWIDPDGADNVIGTLDDDVRLGGSSPAINSGDNSWIPVSVTSDLDGGPRILNTIVDRGAVEVVPAILGDDDGDGDVDGNDVAAWLNCASQDYVPHPPGCGASDFDADGDADQKDFARLQRCLSGENIPAAGSCILP